MIDDEGLHTLPRETSVTSFADLLVKAGRRDIDALDSYLSARMNCEFVEVDTNTGDDDVVFGVCIPGVPVAMGLAYPFTLAQLDGLLEDVDTAYDEWWEEYEDLAALCAAVGDGSVAGLESAMSGWAVAPVTVSRRARKHLVATGPRYQVRLEYPVTVHAVREAAYGLN